MRSVWVLAFIAGCTTARVETACERICNDMVKVCDVGAFPTWESCVQGCAYADERGQDTVGYETCVSEAGCDAHIILQECEHEFGYTED